MLSHARGARNPHAPRGVRRGGPGARDEAIDDPARACYIQRETHARGLPSRAVSSLASSPVTTAPMNNGFRQRRLVFALVFALALSCAPGARAQETDEFGDTAADPVKLFNRGQEAHAKKEYERALELYEEALQLRPDFHEAEFQKAAALVALKRVPE